MIVKVTSGDTASRFTVELSDNARAKAREVAEHAFPSGAASMKDDGILTLLFLHALSIQPPKYTLDELVAGITEDNRHEEP